MSILASQTSAPKNPEAFNKTVPQAHPGHGTLMGNWLEEQALRHKTGVGRNIPGSHLPKQRSTLYSGEFNTSSLPRNDTFLRVFPEPKGDLPLTFNQEYGRFDSRGDQVKKTGRRQDLLEKQVRSL